jgi:hypothetical protein
MYGWAKAMTMLAIAKILSNNTIRCLSCDLLLVFFLTCSMNFTLVKYTFLYRLKLKRWIRIGMAMAAIAKRKYG